MDLTPELLLEAKFSPARRGYDMNEVDDFLERCAEGLDVLMNRLKSEYARAQRAEARLAELQAERGDPPATVAASPPGPDGAADEPAVPEPAPRPVSEAPVDEAPVSETPVSEVQVEEPMRILIAAERTAEAAINDARTEAQRIRQEAESVASTTRSEAETLLRRARTDAEAEARRAGEEARREIEAEVLSLRQDRDQLTADVRSLRRWLDDQRARLRTTARDLQRLVDDPAALRELPVPQLSDDTDHVADADQVADPGQVAAADTAAEVDDVAPEPVEVTATAATVAADDGAQDPTAAAEDPADDEPDVEIALDDLPWADDGQPTRGVPVGRGRWRSSDRGSAPFDREAVDGDVVGADNIH